MDLKRKPFDRARFKKRLEKSGITQKEIAEMVGTSEPNLSDILTGKTKTPWIGEQLWKALEILEKQNK